MHVNSCGSLDQRRAVTCALSQAGEHIGSHSGATYGESENLIAHSPELMSANHTRSRCGITVHAPGELGMKPTGSKAL